jgi:hypothetical protein
MRRKGGARLQSRRSPRLAQFEAVLAQLGTTDVDRPTAVSAKGPVEDHLLQRALDYGDLFVVQFRHEKLGDRA